MPYITSFEILDNEIQKISGRPTVLEALWDGDTQGWFLLLNLYSETGKLLWKQEKCNHLGIVKFGGDIRLFNGEVPLWPEGELTKQWGQQAVKKYGLTFYFPSDKEPDDDCPNWTQRNLAINCNDCGKLIILTDSPYLPKHICSNCNLKREQNERIKLNKFYKDGVYGTYRTKENPNSIQDSSIHWYLRDLSNLEDANKEINHITFSNEELLNLKSKLYEEIENNLSNYKKSDLQGERRNFGSFELTYFQGREYEFECRFNKNHRTLSSLIYRYKTFEQIESKGWTYDLYIIKGVTDRDDAFLRLIHFVAKGSITIQAMNKHYKNILAEKEVFDTLKKLERLECVEIADDVIVITNRGQGIL